MNKMQLFSESRLFLELSEDSLFLAVSFIKDLLFYKAIGISQYLQQMGKKS
jgi:hypothetical protein